MSGMGQVWRHMRTDRSIASSKLDRGTVKRVLSFARPHRRLITVFLGLTVVDACLVVVSPLLVKQIVDNGILAKDTTLVFELAGLMALVAVFGAVLGVVAGWFSSRIGEGLIYDLRTQVFGHVQRQSLAFFTRTQTGALVSRLNNDVIGAQRAFTSTLSGTVSNAISVVVVGIAMFALSWQVTLLCLLLFPLLFALHPGHGLRHGRAALVQSLRDPGPQRDDVLLDELVDRPEVHLRGVDEVTHAALTGPFLPTTGALAEWSGASSHVVPARPAPLGQPRPARRRR